MSFSISTILYQTFYLNFPDISHSCCWMHHSLLAALTKALVKNEACLVLTTTILTFYFLNKCSTSEKIRLIGK